MRMRSPTQTSGSSTAHSPGQTDGQTERLQRSQVYRSSAAQAEREQAGRSPETVTATLRTSNFQHNFSRIPVRSTALPVIQPKLVVGQPNDRYEQEADRVADHVVHVSHTNHGNARESSIFTTLSRPLQPLTLQPKCAMCSQPTLTGGTCAKCKEKQMIQRQTTHRPASSDVLSVAEPMQPSVVESTIASQRGKGSPLVNSVRQSMEQAFGLVDFSHVRIHTDRQSDQLNRSLNARAFTTGTDIFFRQGEYQPGHYSGQKLLAHELTHVVQQSGHQTFTPAQSLKEDHALVRERSEQTADQPIMRQQRDRASEATRFRQQVFVVRDPAIGLGGGAQVPDLAALKRQVMQLRNRGQWTLVLAIHGSEERVAAQAPPDWQRNAVFYDADAINQLFSSDRDWVRWRDEFGPSHLSLVACQVSLSFEQTLIHNLTRHAAGSGSQSPSPTQTAQGLGAGCKPISTARTWDIASGGQLRTRRQYQRLSADEQRQILDELQDLNRRYGYYGAPPIPDDRILDYFFDEPPTASWVVVEVGRDEGHGNLQNTHIPFWNRARGPQAARYRQICDQGVGRLRDRRSRVPAVP
ncbi:MAG: hypothetical protein Kow00121_05360 [Elainellaceae cyanobacterium]